MQEFLEKLYSYEYFGIYLMISIAVLIFLFLIVLFFGKKDKKEREIIATQKLQLEQANTDALKVENNASSVEVPTTVESPTPTPSVEVAPVETTPAAPEVTTPNIESDTLVFPTINTEEVNNEPAENKIDTEIKTDLNTEPVPDFNAPISEPTINDMIAPMAKFSEQEETAPITPDPVETKALNDAPILDKVEEKPFVFANDSEEQSVPNDVFSNVEVPEFNFDNLDAPKEEVKEPAKNIDVFSSVFTPQKEEDMSSIDLPEVNRGVNNLEVKPEEREEVSVPTVDEMEIELPSLKKEVLEEQKDEEIEKPILKDYNLDDLTGETYDINN